MLVLLQTAIPADGTVVEEGFSKLQVFLQQLIDWGVAAGGNIIGAILIFVIGRFLISLIKKMVSKLLEKRHVDAGIQSFVKSLVNILLTILLIIAVIGKLGVKRPPLLPCWHLPVWLLVWLYPVIYRTLRVV